MKRVLNKLRKLGKLDIQIDYHKLFNETAEQVIDANPSEYDGFNIDDMKCKNAIVRVQFNPNDKPMSALSYDADLGFALKDVYNQYLIWEPTK